MNLLKLNFGEWGAGCCPPPRSPNLGFIEFAILRDMREVTSQRYSRDAWQCA